MTAAEQMQMEMENGLACPAAIVYDGAVAFQKIAFAGKLRSGQLQLAKNGLIFGSASFSDSKCLRGQIRMCVEPATDVFEGKKIGIFVDDLRWIFFAAILQNKQSGTHRFLLRASLRRDA